MFALRWLALVLFASSIACGQTYEGRELVKAELLADTSAIVPGKPFTVGLRLRMVPNWYTYWKFSGDAGIPTEIKWNLPAGWKVGEIQWPIPVKLDEPGDIRVYTYPTEVLLMQQITPPASVTEPLVRLNAEANWLVCERLCIPGSANLTLELPVKQNASPANEDAFAKYRRMLPQSWPKEAQANWARDDKGLALRVTSKALLTYPSIDFVPSPNEKTVIGHVTAERTSDGIVFHIPIESGDARSIPGIVVFGSKDDSTHRMAWQLGDTPVAAAILAQPNESKSLITSLFFGFLGGLILNLMPCVLPVISLKIFGFIQHAGSDRRKILRGGLAFVAGIFAWFIALALFLIFLKRAGNDIGWSIQFTNPYFVLGMSVVVLIFALNLFGVFEITLPQSANRKVMSATDGSGHAASFFQGVFATVLGTSCTAPVLGYAVGFALTQSSFFILLMFVAVAAGMGLPYLLLSAQPAWVKFLPKPGAWMERVKQLMGFPMLATLVFLLYVLGAQRGVDAIIWTSAFLLVVSLACWMHGAFVRPIATVGSRVLVHVLIIALLLGSGWYFIGDKFAQTKLETAAATEGWQNFTPEKLNAELAQGHAVFIDFTAAWCVTCKFNEATVLESAAVRDAFQRRGIVKLKADWTNADPVITKYLKQFGRPGVPLYVLYPSGKSAEPIILPELLTKNIVLEKLETIAPQVAAE